jgi:hypothetical protein
MESSFQGWLTPTFMCVVRYVSRRFMFPFSHTRYVSTFSLVRFITQNWAFA